MLVRLAVPSVVPCDALRRQDLLSASVHTFDAAFAAAASGSTCQHERIFLDSAGAEADMDAETNGGSEEGGGSEAENANKGGLFRL